MNIIIQIIIQIIIAYIIAQLTKQDLPKQDPYKLSDFEIPTNNENRCVPYFCGQVDIAPGIILYGDYNFWEVTSTVGNWFTGETDVTDGYKYGLGFMFTVGLSLNRPVYFRHIMWGDEKIDIKSLPYLNTGMPTSFNADYDGCTYGDFSISHETTEREGEKVHNGLGGIFRMTNGYTDDLLQQHVQLLMRGGNSYLLNRPSFEYFFPIYTPPVETEYIPYPNYDGIVLANWLSLHNSAYYTTSSVNKTDYFGGLPSFISNSSNLKPIVIGVSRYPTIPGLSDDRGCNMDANPVAVLYELLTSNDERLNGQKIPTAAVDTASFLSVAERYTLNNTVGNDIGVSFQLEAESDVDDTCLKLLKVTNCIFLLNSKGQLKIRQMGLNDTPDYSFTDDNILSIESFQRNSPYDLITEVVVKYADKNDKYAEKSSSAVNMAVQVSTAPRTTQTNEYIGITNARCAQTLANRSIAQYANGLATITFKVVMKNGGLPRMGEVILVTSSKLPYPLRVIVKSAKMSSENRKDREIIIEGIEDIFKNADSTGYNEYSSSSNDSVAPTSSNNTAFRMLPRFESNKYNMQDVVCAYSFAQNEFTDYLTYKAYHKHDSWPLESALYSVSDKEMFVNYDKFSKSLPAISVKFVNSHTPLDTSDLLLKVDHDWQHKLILDRLSSQAKILVNDEVIEGMIEYNTTSMGALEFKLTGISRGRHEGVPTAITADQSAVLVDRFIPMAAYNFKTFTSTAAGYETTATAFDKIVVRSASYNGKNYLNYAKSADSEAVYTYDSTKSKKYVPIEVAGLKMEGTYLTPNGEDSRTLVHNDYYALAWNRRSIYLNEDQGYFDSYDTPDDSIIKVISYTDDTFTTINIEETVSTSYSIKCENPDGLFFEVVTECKQIGLLKTRGYAPDLVALVDSLSTLTKRIRFIVRSV